MHTPRCRTLTAIFRTDLDRGRLSRKITEFLKARICGRDTRGPFHSRNRPDSTVQ